MLTSRQHDTSKMLCFFLKNSKMLSSYQWATQGRA